MGMRSLLLRNMGMVPAPTAATMGTDLHRHKELLPLVVAAALRGWVWKGTLVQRWSDMAVVAVLSSGTAQDPQLKHLLRCLLFFEAHFGFELRAQHVPGRHNAAV